jgi:hypothetical protein
MIANSTSRYTLIAVVAVATLMALSLATPWSEMGAIAKQILFPILAGAIAGGLMRDSLLRGLGITLAFVVTTGMLAALQSNGFDWRMDGEWPLVMVSLLLSVGSTIGGFAPLAIQSKKRAMATNRVVHR